MDEEPMETETSNPPTSHPRCQDHEEDKERFEVELEFVQCLANPFYLNFLAQHGYFKDKAFVNYLKYLLYWKQPQYARYVRYPHCLHLLDLLQYEAFRKELVNVGCAKFIDDQILLQWQYNAHKKIESQQKAPPFKRVLKGESAAGTAEKQQMQPPHTL
ncbi:mediator of RNA polymerase II transcription subunit 31-like [Oscarella lobularis]|uniref:mediator of RNA polymerase II transcription subunit 31-like n=1 Tax=Oscarella lobularis TaxID=121494 RepID=UPI00331417C2